MKAYRVTYWDSEGRPSQHFEPSHKAAWKFVRSLKAEDDPEAPDGESNPEIEPMEIPTDKAGLLSWLNCYCSNS